MIFKDGWEIRITRADEVYTNIVTGNYELITGDDDRAIIKTLYRIMRKRKLEYEVQQNALNEVLGLYGRVSVSDSTPQNNQLEEIEKKLDDDLKEQVTVNIQKLLDFFKEFAFTPNFRFINTFMMACKHKVGKSYICNYFKLTDHEFSESICEKIKSREFDEIVRKFSSFESHKIINHRFKLYYGSQGTGKTTIAMEESDGNCMVCHSALLPSDLMEDFKFEDGKATFIPSALQNAMVDGKKIVLDEINLLPFESLRFLQSILDNKSQFEYKGKTITIKDGFKIIGTMNLTVNGTIYSLPEPLVDRAEELKEFKLSAENLIGAIL